MFKFLLITVSILIITIMFKLVHKLNPKLQFAEYDSHFTQCSETSRPRNFALPKVSLKIVLRDVSLYLHSFSSFFNNIWIR